MVALEEAPDKGELIYILSPNCSLSWTGMRLLLLVLLACLAAVSLYFTALGAWLVLPFAGLEAVVLVIGVYLSARHGASREQIRIDARGIHIAAGGRQLRPVVRYTRYWGKVSLVRDPRNWYPSRLYIGSHGHFTEIGKALVESERVRFAAELEELVQHGPDLRGSPRTEYPLRNKPVSQQNW